MAYTDSGPVEEIFHGRVFTVTRDEVQLPSGRRTVRDVVRHGGSVAIVPLVDPDKVLLLKQYRFAVDEELWEIPAGTIEPGESPEMCAVRELEEETGYKTGSMTLVARFYTTPGFCDETMHLFVASECRPVGTRSPDEDEDIIDHRLFRIQAALDMAARGELSDGKTLIGLMMATQTAERS